MSATSAVTVRPVRDTDIPAIAAIYAHAVLYGTASFEVDPPDEAEMTRRMRAVVDSGFPYLVAEKDGRVLGYAYAGLYRTRPAYRNSIENSVYVGPDAHRLGVGRALLSELIEIATRRGLPPDDRGDRRQRQRRFDRPPPRARLHLQRHHPFGRLQARPLA